MQSVNATDVRKDFGKYIDEIVRTKPIMVKRSRDYFLGISVEMMLELVEDEVFRQPPFWKMMAPSPWPLIITTW